MSSRCRLAEAVFMEYHDVGGGIVRYPPCVGDEADRPLAVLSDRDCMEVTG